jgi:hypothetical protein
MLDNTELTLGDFLKRWLNEYATHRFGPRNLGYYRFIIKQHIIPSCMSGIALSSLNAAHFQSYYNQALDGGLPAQAVYYHHRLSVRALTDADHMGIAGLPVIAIEFPHIQHRGSTRRVSTTRDRADSL